MRKYVIDTNVYIHAARADEWAQRLKEFFFRSTPEIYLHSVVALELLAGATTEEMRRHVDASFIRPLERRARVFTPSHDAWKRAGSTLARLIRDRKVSAGEGVRKSLVNDCLIAASARDHGFVLVSENVRDFAALGEYLPIECVAPWPMLAH